MNFSLRSVNQTRYLEQDFGRFVKTREIFLGLRLNHVISYDIVVYMFSD